MVRVDFRSLPQPSQGGRYAGEVSVRMQAVLVDNLAQLLEGLKVIRPRRTILRGRESVHISLEVYNLCFHNFLVSEVK